MPSLFPGMNPYLEYPAFWSPFHTRLMVAIAETMAPILRSHYYIEVETGTDNEQDDSEDEDEDLLVGIPDAAVLSASSSKQPGDMVSFDAGTTLTQSRP